MSYYKSYISIRLSMLQYRRLDEFRSTPKAGEFRVAITGIYAGPMFNVLFGNGSILLLSSLLQGGATRFIMSPCGFVLLGALEAGQWNVEEKTRKTHEKS